MAISTALKKSDIDLRYIRRFLLKRFYDRFKDDNRDRFESTSPYAPTTKLPTLRIVDNALYKGKGNPISISTSSHVVRGFFGGVKGVVNDTHGSAGDWKLDTKIQFDKIYMCPVTKREFTDADMEKYRDSLHGEALAYAEYELGPDVTFYSHPGSTDTIIRTKDGEEKITHQQLQKILKPNGV